MAPVDALGWTASGVLLLTLGRQVWVQWRERRTEGVSSWLFIGQMTASLGFTVYSALIGNAVFVLTNAALLLTAIAGQLIYRRNVRREARE
ncbi:hypothetical protein H4F99_13950 [Lysobacter sp. SG-8]|uniref:PQ-loop repeat-containing protein n=2 Tax=Marilutibacter penaei TaxID=2759900 RepID=A0A7W3YFJ8_9GAMM|nr:hypothetical protein [Lysobacter penaei]MBB1089583.1 hypothetical protein [Lysobacter penaei]